MSITPGFASDAVQTLDDTNEQEILGLAAGDKSIRGIYVAGTAANGTAGNTLYVNVPAIHGDNYVPLISDMGLVFSCPRSATNGEGGIRLVKIKGSAAGTEVIWGVVSG